MRKISWRNLLLVLTKDLLLLTLAWYGAHDLTYNFAIPSDSEMLMIRMLPAVLLTKMVALYFFDAYRGMWRYTSVSDLMCISKASIAASSVIGAIILTTYGFANFARSTLVIDCVLTIGFVAGLRLAIRLYYSRWAFRAPGWISRLFVFRAASEQAIELKTTAKKLLIVGAGRAGEMICREIKDGQRLGYRAVGYIDDDVMKVGRKIHGISVMGTSENIAELAQQTLADEILIAIPSATSRQMRGIVARCEESGLPFRTLPGLGEIINGKVTVNTIREVSYRDLLGRDSVRLETQRIGAYLRRVCVLVTGAGGSIGSELCRQICRFEPATLVLYERAESPLYEIEMELKANYPLIEIIPLLGDICDKDQLEKTFGRVRPKIVFHAAAYKHVPMLEHQPWEAVDNNVLGTRNIVEVSTRFSVDRFVLVSTDKAVSPTNVMGASKRVAELFVQSQGVQPGNRTRFMAVRFGNVVGSAGSVVPLFKKQIERGGPVTVTHPDVTRYFMTIPEACQLILQAGAIGQGGEIFVLDMGTPIKIEKMARDLICLSGFEPGEDIEIEFIGLRPGEKLYEELITDEEGIMPTEHEKIMALRAAPCNRDMLNRIIDELTLLAHDQNADGIKKKLRTLVPEYTPMVARDDFESASDMLEDSIEQLNGVVGNEVICHEILRSTTLEPADNFI